MLRVLVPVNVINAGTYGQLFVATDVKSFDFVHLPLGALQRCDHKSHIPSLNHNCVQLFHLTQTC